MLHVLTTHVKTTVFDYFKLYVSIMSHSCSLWVWTSLSITPIQIRSSNSLSFIAMECPTYEYIRTYLFFLWLYIDVPNVSLLETMLKQILFSLFYNRQGGLIRFSFFWFWVIKHTFSSRGTYYFWWLSLFCDISRSDDFYHQGLQNGQQNSFIPSSFIGGTSPLTQYTSLVYK